MTSLKIDNNFLFTSVLLGATYDLSLASCLVGVVNFNSQRLMMVRHYEGLGLNVDYEWSSRLIALLVSGLGVGCVLLIKLSSLLAMLVL